MKNRILNIVGVFGLGLFIGMSVQAQQFAWSNYTGNPGGYGSGDGLGSVARFYLPGSVAVDAGGSVYVADSGNHTIRKLVFSGTACTVSTLAGTPGVTGSADGPGGAALFNRPQGITVDVAGTVYVSDRGNYTIRKITSDGTVTTLAGSPGQIGSSDGTGNGALFGGPMGIAVDSALNLYVADSANHTIRKVTSGGTVTTLAGCPNELGFSDGTGSSAYFNHPEGVAVDASGNVYVADTLNHTIRKISPTGVVTTLAGTPTQYGQFDGTGNNAQFNTPSGIAVDVSGNVYVADTRNNTIRELTAGGVVTTVSGSASATGFVDGAGALAMFNFPRGIAVDGNGNVYLADTNNHTIRKEFWTVVTTVAGTAPKPGVAGNGVLYSSAGMAIDASGNLYVADTFNQVIVECTGTANLRIAGNTPKIGSADGANSPVSYSYTSTTRFNYPGGVAVDSGSNIYVADTQNSTIRELSMVSGTLMSTTICGFAAAQGSVDASGTSAMFNNPMGIAVDSGTNLYVADTYNQTIRKITCSGTTWTASTISGSPGISGTTDGTGSGALFSFPYGIAVDGSGNVFVADSQNYTIRKLTLSGGVWSSQTIAGTPGVSGTADGVGGAAQFGFPTMLALDSSGNLFVADTRNSTIRMLINSGNSWAVTTIGGTPGVSGGVSGYGGVGTQALFSGPIGIAVQSGSSLLTDIIYVMDSGNNRVSMGQTIGTGTASGITSGSAVLTGIVNLNASGSTSVYFQYGTTTAYGSVSGTQTFGAGSNLVNVNSSVSGLTASKLYDYRMVVVNASGTTYGLNQVFSTLASGVPGITSSTTITGTNGYPMSYTITASNGATSFGVTGLPPGISLNPITGVIAGIPTVTASTSGILTAVNGLGTGSTTVVFKIINLPPPVITSSGSATTIYESSISYQIVANNYTTSYGASGLPPGVTVSSSTGLISGGPTAVGTFNVTLSATNSLGSSTMPFILTVTPPYVWNNFAGLGTNVSSYRTSVSLSSPMSVAMDSGSNIYVVNRGDYTIRKISPSGNTTILAGCPGVNGAVDGTGTNALFYIPEGIAVDSGSNVYVTDNSNRVRMITPAGVVTTLAGGSYGSADGTGTNAQFQYPQGLAVDSGSNVYVADTSNNKIRKITSAGVVTTLAGSGVYGNVNGTGIAAQFSNPMGVAVDSGSNVYVADTYSCLIRKVTPAGVVTTLAGTAAIPGSLNSAGTSAQFGYPEGVAIDSGSNLFVTDSTYHTVRKMVLVSGTWQVYTIGGISQTSGILDAIGCASSFNMPTNLCVSSSGSIFVADYRNSRIAQGTLMTAPTITSAATTTGTAGVAFSYNTTANNVPMSYLATGLVAGLTLDSNTGILSGTPGVSGTFSLGISAVNLAGTGSATLTLTLQPGIPPEQSWGATVFTSTQLLNPSISSDLATPAGDGITNLMKYALHLNPFVNGVNGLPVQSITTISGTNYLTLTYTKVIAATDLTYTVQVSTDLQTWNSGPTYTGVLNTVTDSNGITQSITVQSLIPLSGSRQFIRLQVSH